MFRALSSTYKTADTVT